MLITVSIGVSVISTHEAHASTRVCSSLQAQLARLGSSGDASQYNRYNSALTNQAAELKKAKSLARRGNCSANKSSQCRTLLNTIPKMEANLSKLRATRDRYAGNASSANARQLKAQLKANNCNQQVLFPSTRQKSGAQIQQASAPSKTVVTKRTTARNSTGTAISPAPPTTLTSGVRTLCVRTCDGYFFPVSFGADLSQVKTDEQACAAMCPGTETKLYMHKVPEEETEAMVSISGERYVDSPTAFAYLQPGHLENRPESCSCRAQQQAAIPNQTPIPAGMLQTATTDKGEKTALPAMRPDMHADPDTQAVGNGGFTLELMATMLDGLSSNEPLALVRNDAVRVVLPEFLPDPEAAIGLQVPAPTSVQ
ncbi:MAG: DUF2865 domain-containing protein [Ahrensia sp.]